MKRETDATQLENWKNCRVCQPVCASARPHLLSQTRWAAMAHCRRWCSSASTPSSPPSSDLVTFAGDIPPSWRDKDGTSVVSHERKPDSQLSAGRLANEGRGYAVIPVSSGRRAPMPGTKRPGFADRRPMPDHIALPSVVIWAEGSVLGRSTGWWGIRLRRALRGDAPTRAADASFAYWPHASPSQTSTRRLYCALLVSCRIAKEVLTQWPWWAR
jgi:hypothetical protein